MGIHNWLRRVSQRAIEIRVLDRVELPGVVLRFDLDPHAFAVVVIFAPDKCFGDSLGNVSVDVFSVLAPAGDAVAVEFAKDIPLISLVRLHELAGWPSLHCFVQSCALILVLVVPVFLRREPFAFVAKVD